MATQNQIEANRRNAQHSTGPTSPEGKAKSSMNALKTGIDAKSELIRFEDPEAHATLIAEYYDRFQPATPEERCLVDRLISSEWLHRRYSSVEGALWELEFKGLSTPDLGVAYYRASDQLARVDRRLNSAQRNFDKALKELRAIQSRRPEVHQSEQPDSAATAAETLPANDVAGKTLKPELGSFPTPVNEPADNPPIIQASPCTTISSEHDTPPNPQNEEPDLPQAA